MRATVPKEMTLASKRQARFHGRIEADGRPCGHCDNCDAGTVEKAAAETADLPFALKSRVRHNKFGEGVVMRYEADKVVVQFDSEGEKAMVTDFVIRNSLMEEM